jgi:hypothetical protein
MKKKTKRTRAFKAVPPKVTLDSLAKAVSSLLLADMRRQSQESLVNSKLVAFGKQLSEHDETLARHHRAIEPLRTLGPTPGRDVIRHSEIICDLYDQVRTLTDRLEKIEKSLPK